MDRICGILRVMMTRMILSLFGIDGRSRAKMKSVYQTWLS